MGLLCLSSSIRPTTLTCEVLAVVGMSGSALPFLAAEALALVGCSSGLFASVFAVLAGSSALALGALLLRRNFFLVLSTVSSSKVGVKSRKTRLNSSSVMRVLGLLSTSLPLSLRKETSVLTPMLSSLARLNSFMDIYFS